jgi:hypothetical protein
VRGTRTEGSPGVLRLRVFIGTDPVTGNPRQLSPTIRATQQQADSALAELVTELASAGAPLPSSSSLDECLERWLDHITSTRSPATVRGYRFKVKRIGTKLGHVRLDRLTAEHQARRAPGRPGLIKHANPHLS